MSKSRRRVGMIDDIPPGGSLLVPVGKFGVAVYNVGGEYFAIANYCSHRGGPVCLGPRVSAYTADAPYAPIMSREGELLRCPWHGWDYDIKSGEAVAANKRLRGYKVLVEDGEIFLEGL